jgi:16S rRNA (cytosine(967)-C(5))-methyltransferase
LSKIKKVIRASAAIIGHYEKNQTSLRNAMKILPNLLEKDDSDIHSQVHAFVFETIRHHNIINRVMHTHFQRFLSDKIPSNLRNLLRVVTYLLTLSPDINKNHSWEEIFEVTLNSTEDLKFVSLLRKYFEALRNWDLESILADIKDNEEKIAVQYSHPTWLVRDLISFYGLETAMNIIEANNQPQHFYLRLNLVKYDKNEIISHLSEEEVKTEQDPHLFDVVKAISWKIPIPRLPSFTKDFYYMQDKGSALISHILDPQENEVVLDACAAPGGKTTHIASLQHDSGNIIALDNNFRRLLELISKIRRYQINSVSPILLDLRFQRLIKIKFDKILVDAPCSGSGTFRSRPDAKWRVDRHQVKWLSKLQYTLLLNASTMLINSRNASLVYSTCSLHPLENEEVIKKFLSRNPNFELQQQKIVIGNPSPEFTLAQRLFPHLNQTDGFSIFKLGWKSN